MKKEYITDQMGSCSVTEANFRHILFPPAVCGEKITEENMIERARELGKKFIVVIRQNSYSIVNVN